ncbi:hypothetical protein AGMMS49587_04710 [Spirochaetia bacterium]|nr:hypothetical protein AGMMS49587_04710 [Spirochaetia bacterium]
MKKIIIFVLLGLCTANILTAQRMSKNDLQKMYIDYLRSEGISPSIASDFNGNIFFDDENWRYWIIIDEATPNMFRLWLYYPYLGETWSYDKLEKAKSIFENTVKIVRVEFNGGGDAGGWYMAEIPLNRPEDFKHIFRIYLTSLSAANRTFYDILKSIK